MHARSIRAVLAAAVVLLPSLAPLGVRAAAATLEAVAAPPGFEASHPIQRIAFGSCAEQDKPQPIWAAVEAASPDLFLFLGDNIYADTREPAVFEAKYAALAAQPGFARLRATTPVMATWDDHDFGENDAGGDFPAKDVARDAFFRFWQEPAQSPRRDRDGVYASAVFGPPGRRVQVILLDLRWNRTPIARNLAFPDDDAYRRWATREARTGRPVPGPYARDPSPAATMLGERQWAWLREQLHQPADSGLTEEWAVRVPNALRVGEAHHRANFGLVEIDWEDRELRLGLRDTEGVALLGTRLRLDDLVPR